MTTRDRWASYDCRQWLMNRFLEGKRKNSRWSLRSFASKLGIPASTLSEILSGKRLITKKMAERLTKKLGLPEEERQLLIRSAALAQFQKTLGTDISDKNRLGEGWQELFLIPIALDPALRAKIEEAVKRFQKDISELFAHGERKQKCLFRLELFTLGSHEYFCSQFMEQNLIVEVCSQLTSAKDT